MHRTKLNKKTIVVKYGSKWRKYIWVIINAILSIYRKIIDLWWKYNQIYWNIHQYKSMVKLIDIWAIYTRSLGNKREEGEIQRFRLKVLSSGNNWKSSSRNQ